MGFFCCFSECSAPKSSISLLMYPILCSYIKSRFQGYSYSGL
uniref:Uncharacterized protein n=1 Tax=Arundo donax TaxID=35708 RepID=A0A0A8ZEX0_ARUDO